MSRWRVWAAATTIAVAVGCGTDDGGPIEVIDDDPSCAVSARFGSIHANRLQTATCARAGCHDATSTQAGLDFEKAESEVWADLVGVASTSEPTKVRVVAGDASASYFYEKLSNPSVGGALGRMPPSGSLAACEIEAVGAWIDAGALAN